MNTQTASLRRTAFEALGLLIISIAVAIAANTFRPTPLPWATDWTAAKLAALMDKGAISLDDAYTLWADKKAYFIDARSKENFDAEHILNARSFPYAPFSSDMESQIEKLPQDKPLILYCDGVHCSLSEELAELLKFNGRTDVLVLAEGIEGWRNMSWPLEGDK